MQPDPLPLVWGLGMRLLQPQLCTIAKYIGPVQSPGHPKIVNSLHVYYSTVYTLDRFLTLVGCVASWCGYSFRPRAMNLVMSITMPQKLCSVTNPASEIRHALMFILGINSESI